MKIILTFIFALFITAAATANTPNKPEKVKTTTLEVELNFNIKKKDVYKTKVARLYFSKNSRINKALKFDLKANNEKIA